MITLFPEGQYRPTNETLPFFIQRLQQLIGGMTEANTASLLLNNKLDPVYMTKSLGKTLLLCSGCPSTQ